MDLPNIFVQECRLPYIYIYFETCLNVIFYLNNNSTPMTSAICNLQVMGRKHSKFFTHRIVWFMDAIANLHLRIVARRKCTVVMK